MSTDPRGAIVAIFGATSAIAEHVARNYARRGARLFLVGRDAAHLAAIVGDLQVRGAAQVEPFIADLDEPDRYDAMLDACRVAVGEPDVAVVAFGVLGDQAVARADCNAARRQLVTNFVSPACLLTVLANRFEARGGGVIAVITSVAGDRGRQSNYVYGAAKGGLSIFLQGLRHRLHARGVAVLDVKPGSVDTPMTARFPKGRLWASPDRVAADICRAIEQRRATLYTPWFWRWIMAVIRRIPAFLFHRLKI